MHIIGLIDDSRPWLDEVNNTVTVERDILLSDDLDSLLGDEPSQKCRHVG